MAQFKKLGIAGGGGSSASVVLPGGWSGTVVPNTGSIELREAISRYLARSRGIYADPNQIIIGSGSEYLYSLIVGLLGRSMVYAIESPSYKKIEQVYR